MKNNNFNDSSSEAQLPDNNDDSLIIYGRNAVRRAITNGNTIERIYIQLGIRDGSMGEMITLCKENKIIFKEVPKTKLESLLYNVGGEEKKAHQGIVAQLSAIKFCEVDDIIAFAKSKEEDPFIIMLDEILDPHNFGAIVRSAEAFGAHGIVISKHRSAPASAAAVKSSAGALLSMNIAKIPNINNCIDELKKEGIWIAGADMDGESAYKTNLKGALAIVIGSEGKGLSQLTRKKCDFVISIPMKGNINSLNASNAAAILMAEKNRQELVVLP